MAGVERIELSYTVLETAVLPLNYTPMEIRLLRAFSLQVLHSSMQTQGDRIAPYWQRVGDSNPRAAHHDLLPFQGSPFDLLGNSLYERQLLPLNMNRKR